MIDTSRICCLSLLVLASASPPIFAKPTTFICTDERGHRAIQDHGCAANSVDVRVIDGVHRIRTLSVASDDTGGAAARGTESRGSRSRAAATTR